MTSGNCLPVDIVEVVVGWLLYQRHRAGSDTGKGQADLAAWARTCRYYYELLTPALYQHPFLEGERRGKAFLRTIQNQQTSDSTIFDLQDKTTSSPAASLPPLKDGGDPIPISANPSSLHATSLGLAVKSLDLSLVEHRWEFMDDRLLDLTLKHVPNLTRLLLPDCKELSDAIGPTLASHVPRLQHLSLSHYIHLSAACIPYLEKLKDLKELDISGMRRFGDEEGKKLVCALSKLRSLTVCQTLVGDEFVKWIVNQQTLALSGQVHNYRIAQRLKILDISRCYNVVYADEMSFENSGTLQIITDSYASTDENSDPDYDGDDYPDYDTRYYEDDDDFYSEWQDDHEVMHYQ